MEYSLVRASEINRISPEQLITLQTAERNRGYAFAPFELQSLFNLSPLKTVYMLPENDIAQSGHNQRLKNAFYEAKLFPTWLVLSEMRVDQCHLFDEAVQNRGIDFLYSGGPVKKKKLRDEIENWQDQ